MNGEVIMVAVDASKEITDYALEWAVRNVTKAMDSLILLAILPSRGSPPARVNHTHLSRTHNFLSSLLKKWGLGKNRSSFDQTGLNSAIEQDMSQRTYTVSLHMMQQLCSAHNVMQVHTEVKVVADAKLGSVAAKAGEVKATWIILDRRLKKESESCLKQLNCNVVLMDHAIPKILRAVNPIARRKLNMNEDQFDPTVADMLGVLPSNIPDDNSETTRSSLGIDSPISETDASFSLSSAEKEQFHKSIPSTTKFKSSNSFLNPNSDYIYQEMGAQATFSTSLSYSKSQALSKSSIFDIGDSPRKSSASPFEGKRKSHSSVLKSKSDTRKVNSIKATQAAPIPARRSTDSPHLRQKHEMPNQVITRKHSLPIPRSEALASPSSSNIERTSSIRRAISISIKHPPTPPPLCSVCKHNAPIFGKAPRKFSYKEIERATNGFSSENFLAEGGYGSVYKGVLPDGQVVAVKQHKIMSAQGASEFCSEVEVLSCAQHRNLVMLVGYCIETEWLLIYEFACNGSLDKHLHGAETKEVMAWGDRMKVAMGAARGLRYLHEDCRVGCIVHRDFRPNNILLTHDFEPMVGDFGLARWQADGQSAEETRVIGAVGYLAPEYTQTGLITEKADVYAFGVVLLELLSGNKATDFSRKMGQKFALDWGRLLLQKKMINELIDPRLEQNYVEKEVECMIFAAGLCISPNPEQRPRMSKVLKVLEGDMPTDMVYSFGQCTPNYPKKYLNNMYGIESPMLQIPDYSTHPYLMQAMHCMNLSPSRTNAHTTNDRNSTFKSLTASTQHTVVSSGWGLNQSVKNTKHIYKGH